VKVILGKLLIRFLAGAFCMLTFIYAFLGGSIFRYYPNSIRSAIYLAFKTSFLFLNLLGVYLLGSILLDWNVN
jgi:hypothetical protein